MTIFRDRVTLTRSQFMSDGFHGATESKFVWVNTAARCRDHNHHRCVVPSSQPTKSTKKQICASANVRLHRIYRHD